jgi:hypothetical protein
MLPVLGNAVKRFYVKHGIDLLFLDNAWLVQIRYL